MTRFSVVEYENRDGGEYRTRIFTAETAAFVEEVAEVGGMIHTITTEDDSKVPAGNLAEIRDEAAGTVRWLNDALEAARTIRDRADAAYSRGLREDDTQAMLDAQKRLDAALALAGKRQLKEKVEAL